MRGIAISTSDCAYEALIWPSEQQTREEDGARTDTSDSDIGGAVVMSLSTQTPISASTHCACRHEAGNMAHTPPLLYSIKLWDRLQLPRKFTRDLLLGLVLGITFSLSSTSLALLIQGWRRKRAVARVPPRPIELRSDEVVDGVIGLIGNTPLIRINSLSDALGVEILGKAEVGRRDQWVHR